MKRFSLGGIPEIMGLSVFISIFYVTIAVYSEKFPLIENDVSSVFATLVIGIFISFVVLFLLELFVFERDLDWNGRKKKSKKKNANPILNEKEKGE